MVTGQDPSRPVDIGCGTLLPIRASALASILQYTHDPNGAPARVEDKPFEFNCIVLTTRGHWEFHGSTGKADVDGTSLTVGVAGHAYGCRHFHGCRDSNLIVGLRSGALDSDYPPLFAKQIVPAKAAPRLIQGALRSPSTDGFDSLVFTLFDEASTASRQKATATPNLRMQRAKRFIELHAFEQLTLADIAGELGLSPFTTLRQFRSATGKTPYAYISELRLTRAKQRLADSDASVRSIAASVGFNDLAYFSRWFKANTGCRPSSYRP